MNRKSNEICAKAMKTTKKIVMVHEHIERIEIIKTDKKRQMKIVAKVHIHMFKVICPIVDRNERIN